MVMHDLAAPAPSFGDDTADPRGLWRLCRAMFDHSPLPMWIVEPGSQRFIAVNDAAVRHYGYGRDEFASLTAADLTADGTADGDAGAPGSPVVRHRTRDGQLISVQLATTEFELDGAALRLIAIHDVTQRVRSEDALHRNEDQLRHAQKMEVIGQLGAGVAHDVNNVLTVVKGYAAFLEESLEPHDARLEDARQIRRAADRGAGITRQLLAVIRHTVASPRAVDVDELVGNFLPMLRRLVGPAVAVVAQGGRPPAVLIDPGQLEQVLMNLASNARDAMPGGGRLTIESRCVEIDADTARTRGLQPGRHVEIAVTDTGSGMDAATQQRIFEAFFTTKDVGRGTGLGLAMAHDIIAQAGGAIAVYSELGRGSTFRIQLPASEAPAAAINTAIEAAPRTLPSIGVLVVDNQPDVRSVAARILQDAGCHVLQAGTADEARRICVRHDEPIDLVVFDVVLPDAYGDELARQLRELRPALRFVAMTGYPAGALTATGATPDNLLAKPFSPSELRLHVARAWGDGAEPVAPSAPAAEVTAARRRALVADDDDALRKVVVRLLRRARFDVVDVSSGDAAITALEAAPFDVVVSDVQMPGGGGLDLLRAVRRIDLDVPVVLVTGDPSVDAAASAVEHGAFRYLTKPLDADHFIKVVEHATRAHALARLRREAFSASGAHAGVGDRAGLEVRFEQAIGGIWMAFQPIVHASSGALFGVEALMRSNEPSIPTPPALLSAAENLGRLEMLGRKVRALAATEFSQHTIDAMLFVNLHPDDIHDVDLIEVSSPLCMIAPRVVLEITERASLESSTSLTERLARLRELGFRLAIDDIGAGYSGLASFAELTPEVVKIDMSMVRDVHKSAAKQRTIRALCQLCHEIGTLVVGEGVETHDERDVLVDLGCDLLQGYLLGRPSRDLPRGA